MAIFFSLRGLPLPGCLSTVPVSRNFLNSLLNTTLCRAFHRKFVCRPLCYVPLQIQTFLSKILSSLLNTMLIVDKHCSDVCCDEFSVPQIDRKSKQVKEQWHGQFYLLSVPGKTCISNTKNIKICGWITKLGAIKNAICLHFLLHVHLQKIWIFNFLR